MIKAIGTEHDSGNLIVSMPEEFARSIRDAAAALTGVAIAPGTEVEIDYAPLVVFLKSIAAHGTAGRGLRVEQTRVLVLSESSLAME